MGLKLFIHPLLQVNTSTLEQESFSSIFNGKEFFLKDHVIQNQKILPGVAYLEMVNQAARLAISDFDQENETIQLKNIVWLRPLIVDDTQRVTVNLFPNDKGEIIFEVSTDEFA